MPTPSDDRSSPDVPAYLANGPRAGEATFIGSRLSVIQFPIPRDTWMPWVPYDIRYPQPLKVHEYELLGEVLLYKYKGESFA